MTEAEGPEAASRIVVGMYSFKTTDPIKLAIFWGQLMDLPLADGASDDLAMLDFHHQHGSVTWMFERVGSKLPGRRCPDLGAGPAVTRGYLPRP